MVSIIIPTLDEERYLPGCLDAVLPQCSGDDVEVLVVDGGSRDATPSVAHRRRLRVVDCPRGRGRQMNAGVRAARGSLLVFLPADTRLPEGAVKRLVRIDRDGAPAAGGFRQRFDDPGLLLRAVSALHNLRAVLTGVHYGDQVPFVRRELFRVLEGFREDVDLEDVEIGSRLRRLTRPRPLELTVVTSARRFERAGALRATAEAAWILAHWMVLRRPPSSRTFFTPVR